MLRTVLSSLNTFLESCSNTTLGYELKVDSSNAGHRDRFTKLFDQNGPHRMFEVFDVDAADSVSSFPSALVDVLCCSSRLAEAACSVTKGIDVVEFVFKR